MTKNLLIILCVNSALIIFCVNSVCAQEDISQNEIIDSNYGSETIVHGNDSEHPIQPYNNISINETWFDMTKRMLVAPAGQIVVHMAKEMISRSTGNSQVLC